jgi:hypothetical protein
LKTAHRLRSDDRVHDAAPDSALSATVVAIGTAAVDTMVFAGIGAEEALEAIRRDAPDVDVPTPARARRVPLKPPGRLWRRRGKEESTK